MTAYVASASAASAAARYADTRAGTATTMTNVDPINYSIGARSEEPRFEFDRRYEEQPQQRRQRRASIYEEPVAFANAVVSREVGAGLVQAQASIDYGLLTPIDAQTGIKTYEKNIRILTPPEQTDVAVPFR